MKYILTAALVIGLFANASAQQPLVKVVRAVRTHPVENETNLHVILDKLQAETENTVVFPLMQMTKAAFTKVQALKHTKHERIRTNNNPKRVVNPNRA
jgi:hypothetical protein